MFYILSDNKSVREDVSEGLIPDREGKVYNFGTLTFKGQPYNKPIWFSLDENSYNFHITPQENDIKDYLDECTAFRKQLSEELKERLGGTEAKVKCGGGKGIKDWTTCHRYLEVIQAGYSYLICFQTLYCTKDNLISCDYGKIQFHKFSEEYNGPNHDSKGKFIMMYPDTMDENGEKIGSDSCVKNTKYAVGSNVSEVADAFISFINN